MNVQEMRVMLLWSSWFTLVGALVLTSQLCKDRFQYVSVSCDLSRDCCLIPSVVNCWEEGIGEPFKSGRGILLPHG